MIVVDCSAKIKTRFFSKAQRTNSSSIADCSAVYLKFDTISTNIILGILQNLISLHLVGQFPRLPTHPSGNLISIIFFLRRSLNCLHDSYFFFQNPGRRICKGYKSELAVKKKVELEAAASPDEGTTANVNPGAIGATAAVLATLFAAFQVFQTGQSEAPPSPRSPLSSAPLPATVTKEIDVGTATAPKPKPIAPISKKSKGLPGQLIRYPTEVEMESTSSANGKEGKK